MAGDQFRVQELNPFMEWHLHASAPSFEVASKEANRIARMIGRKTRVWARKEKSSMRWIHQTPVLDGRLMRFLLLPLLLFPLTAPALAQMKFVL